LFFEGDFCVVRRRGNVQLMWFFGASLVERTFTGTKEGDRCRVK
jgi:hypothetical protein